VKINATHGPFYFLTQCLAVGKINKFPLPSSSQRQGEEECAAALRLLRRLRREYGPRFFDVVAVDSWYANGPFVKTVVDE